MMKIVDVWEDYRTSILIEKLSFSESALEEARAHFYVGAAMLFTVIEENMAECDADDDLEGATAILAALMVEFDEWRKEVGTAH